jgi:hypothetical protein
MPSPDFAATLRIAMPDGLDATGRGFAVEFGCSGEIHLRKDSDVSAIENGGTSAACLGLR